MAFSLERRTMYYIKIFFLYSLLGFVMESTLYKIVSSNRHSSIFYGPVTTVYGFGIIAIELLNKYLFTKINTNIIVKIIIEYLILTIILSLIECLGGHILNALFNIDLWDYSNKTIHFGKYVCLINSLIWGLLGILYIHIFKNITDAILTQITSKEMHFCIIIFIIDLILVLINKLKI